MPADRYAHQVGNDQGKPAPDTERTHRRPPRHEGRTWVVE